MNWGFELIFIVYFDQNAFSTLGDRITQDEN